MYRSLGADLSPPSARQSPVQTSVSLLVGTGQSLISSAPARFLLKYASRDEVEVLARGSSGVVEMR